MKISREGKTITIECPDNGAADHLEVALRHRQWVQFDGKGVRLAQTDEEPKMSDYDALLAGHIAPIYKQGGEPKQLVPPTRDNGQYWSCYVQHIGARFCGNHPFKRPYDYYFRTMVEIGFVLLRSPLESHGKFFEIWYLPGNFSLKGDLKGASQSKLNSWLFEHIGPGTTTFDGERWALTWD